MTERPDERVVANIGIVSHGQSRALMPRDLAEAMRLAEMLAETSIIPAEFKGKPGDVFVAMQYGMEVGLSPLQAIQSVAVIKGRPCLWGDAVLGLVMASPAFGAIEEYFVREGTDPEHVYAVCRVRRRGREEWTERRFSWADAQRAQLASKDLYRMYPQRMLPMRARAWALRDVFPDVLKGLQIREEVEDYAERGPATNATTSSPVEALMPRRKAAVDPNVGAIRGEGTESEPLTRAPAPPPAPQGVPDDEPSERPDRAILLAEMDAPADALGRPVRALRQVPIPEQQQLTPAVPPTLPEGKLRFALNGRTIETNGATKDQLLATFRLVAQVNKRAGSDLAHAVLRKEFGLTSRTDLTEEQAERYLIRLREIIAG